MQATAAFSPAEQIRAGQALRPPLAADRPGSTTLWGLIRPHVWAHRWAIVLCLTLNGLPGVAIALQAVAPKYLLDQVLTAPGLTDPQRYTRLGALLGVYLLVSLVLRMFAWYASYRIFTRVRETITLELRSKFFRHINGLCLRFHGRHTSGELFTYVMGSPLGEISSFYHNLAMNVPNALCAFVVSIAWLSFWDTGLTLILLVCVIATVLSANSGHSQLRSLVEDFQNTEGKVIGRVADIFRGNRDVKMYAIEDKMSAAFEQSAAMLREKTCDRDVKTHHVNMRQEAVGIMSFVLVCIVAAGRFINGHLTQGELWTYLAAFAVLQAPVQLIFQLGLSRGRAQASLSRLNRVLETDSSTPEPRHPAFLPERAELKVRNLEFSYGAKEPVIKDINLTIPFGQRIALVGPSGSGKSTLAKLLLRLYDPDAGSVSFGDVDLRECRTTDIRQRFGVVPQDPYFFQTSIRENLLIVHPSASSERIREVCELASIWGFIEGLPEGLDTLIGEGGARLSGGQRQRLAIARALLHEPDYVIFDEATSALDTVSERMVQEAFSRVLPGRTAVFIAHRLSTIKDCDRVIVIDEGRIVQDGAFEELRRQPGLFQRMVESNEF